MITEYTTERDQHELWKLRIGLWSGLILAAVLLPLGIFQFLLFIENVQTYGLLHALGMVAEAAWDAWLAAHEDGGL